MKVKTIEDYWSVTVKLNGEEIVTIESKAVSGRELTPKYEEIIRTCAKHLLAFVGEGETT